MLDQVAAAVGRRAGLNVTGAMREKLCRSLHRTAEARGVPVTVHLSEVVADAAAQQRLVEELTVHESSFFRDAGQLAAVAEHVLPTLPGPIRIWSAGCANGQEPYSLAMLLLERGHQNARVVATDISTRALARAEAGRYSDAALRGLSPERRAAWLARDGDDWSVAPAPRRMVTFARHNLALDVPPFPPGACQLIFCRNVLIYFAPEAMMTTITRMRDWLPPGGVLVLGASESLWRVTEMFDLVSLNEAFVYRKPAAAGAAARAGSARGGSASPGGRVAAGSRSRL
ncbi:MAG TPA: protein-glutamate O-methyltransferase CheR, partial [Pilimelia sp.]|nr:protein-glutamate O-methyltransferase CheR [Pilimelia sp.]